MEHLGEGGFRKAVHFLEVVVVVVEERPQLSGRHGRAGEEGGGARGLQAAGVGVGGGGGGGQPPGAAQLPVLRDGQTLVHLGTTSFCRDSCSTVCSVDGCLDRAACLA